MKLKYNDYVHIHKALSKLSSVNLIIESIAEEKYDDLVAKLPVAYHEQVKNIAKIILDYVNKTEEAVWKYYKQAPKEDKKTFMIYVSKNVPKKYQGYCRELYLGHDIHVLKSGTDKNLHYKKWKDICADDYKRIFMEENDA